MGEEIGPADVKIPAQKKEQLNTRVFDSSTIASGEEAPNCLICQTEFENEEVLRILSCSHEFHK